MRKVRRGEPARNFRLQILETPHVSLFHVRGHPPNDQIKYLSIDADMLLRIYGKATKAAYIL